MPLGDRFMSVSSLKLTDTQKDEKAVSEIRRILNRTVLEHRRIIRRLKNIVDTAPSGKVALLNRLGEDKDEAQTLISEIVQIVNNHKGVNFDEDVAF